MGNPGGGHPVPWCPSASQSVSDGGGGLHQVRLAQSCQACAASKCVQKVWATSLTGGVPLGQAKTAGVPGIDRKQSQTLVCVGPTSLPPPEKCLSERSTFGRVRCLEAQHGRVWSRLSLALLVLLQAGRQAGGQACWACRLHSGASRRLGRPPLLVCADWRAGSPAGSGSACCSGAKPHSSVGSGVLMGLFINPVQPTPLLAGGSFAPSLSTIIAAVQPSTPQTP